MLSGNAISFFSGSLHLFRRAFEEPAAARGKQRVAAEKIVFEKISDVAGGVAGNKKNFALELADLNFIAFFDAARQTRNARAVAPVAVYVDLVMRQQFFIAAGMVAMMMGIEDRDWLDFFLLDAAEHRFGFRRIDDGGLLVFSQTSR